MRNLEDRMAKIIQDEYDLHHDEGRADSAAHEIMDVLNAYIGFHRLDPDYHHADGHTWELIAACRSSKDPPHVFVIASDYAYEGWISCFLFKRTGEVRFVVEDSCGRLFIHNAKQLKLKGSEG